ncbi:hypothetical protein CANARDRAFT_7547 [[Candida] arabinofermentans NRRL YB-2248]|uniref:DUF1748-domain-containing protein n=1 Tax=[Candida] arabinofermentans NRRL YB-2248 TaxID=983967 RepID=A0A1E4T105_9ASCO|nr:hypothetical protein CANARDRAFT_7547 [[Candida] arabinofermentans NRRL YB-2248]
MGLGRYFHYAVDLVMISMILAGIKKSTGLSLQVESLAHSSDSRSFLTKYLNFGESCLERIISLCRTSGMFKQRRIENSDDLRDAFKRGVNDLIDDTTRSSNGKR